MQVSSMQSMCITAEPHPVPQYPKAKTLLSWIQQFECVFFKCKCSDIFVQTTAASRNEFWHLGSRGLQICIMDFAPSF